MASLENKSRGNDVSSKLGCRMRKLTKMTLEGTFREGHMSKGLSRTKADRKKKALDWQPPEMC